MAKKEAKAAEKFDRENLAAQPAPAKKAKPSTHAASAAKDGAASDAKAGKKNAAAKLLGWDAAKQTGTFVGGDNPWGDAAKGEQLAKQFIDQGADIVGPVAGSTGNGSIKAMAAAGKWAIGVDTDQALSLPEFSKAILTSAQKAIDVAVLETIKKNAGGDMGGENFLGTLKNKGVLISPFHDLASAVPADLKAEVDQLSADIASGTVKIADYLK